MSDSLKARKNSEDEHISASEPANDLWVEEVDEVMFQPEEIVPNEIRAYVSASDLQKKIASKVRK